MKPMTREQHDKIEAMNAKREADSTFRCLFGADALEAESAILGRGLETPEARWLHRSRFGSIDVQRSINIDEASAQGFRGAYLINSTQGWALREADAGSCIIEIGLTPAQAIDAAREWQEADITRRWVGCYDVSGLPI